MISRAIALMAGRLMLAAGIVLLACLPAQRALPHATVATTVTFDREIRRIFKRRCIACHSERNLAFPLTSYERTRPWAGSIQQEVLRRHMPPWRAVPGYGDFTNDASLTSRELQFLVAWIEGNGPKSNERLIVAIGESVTPAAELLRGDFDKWLFGTPERVVSLPSIAVRKGEGDIIRWVEFEAGLPSDAQLRAIEFIPGDRRVIRGAEFYVRDSGQWLGSWTPWYSGTSLPEGVALRLPAKAMVAAKLYLRSTDSAARVSGRIGLQFASAPRSLARDVEVAARQAGDPFDSATGVRILEGSTRLDDEVSVLAVSPEMPTGTRGLSVSAHLADGSVRPLLLIRDALSEWPTPYLLRMPLRLPAGSEVRVAYEVDAVAGSSPDGLRVRLRVIDGLRDSVSEKPAF